MERFLRVAAGGLVAVLRVEDRDRPARQAPAAVDGGLLQGVRRSSRAEPLREVQVDTRLDQLRTHYGDRLARRQTPSDLLQSAAPTRGRHPRSSCCWPSPPTLMPSDRRADRTGRPRRRRTGTARTPACSSPDIPPPARHAPLARRTARRHPRPGATARLLPRAWAPGMVFVSSMSHRRNADGASSWQERERHHGHVCLPPLADGFSTTGEGCSGRDTRSGHVRLEGSPRDAGLTGAMGVARAAGAEWGGVFGEATATGARR
ncbi:UNVERIFIED_ORG: hypothetical protein FHR35_000558 [Microbispora rosea subsp. rosea]